MTVTRGGQDKETDRPERKCLVTGESQPKAGLIRFVVGPEGQVVADIAGKLPGRGFYVAADREALEVAVRTKVFARGAKRQVTVPEDLVETVEAGLVRRVQNLISLARKAGLAVAGYEKVKDWLAKEHARVLFQASDGSARGKSKLRGTGQKNGYFNCLTGDELGLAFGREHVIHGALAAGGLTKRIVEDAQRLSGVRKSTDGGTARPEG